MTTKKLVPRASGEGAMGVTDNAWGEAYYDTGNFNKGLFVSGHNITQVIAETVTQGGLGGEWERNVLDIYYNGGNVGIGTTNPGAKLDLQLSAGHPFYIRSGSGANDNLFVFEVPAAGPQLRMYEVGTSNVKVKISTHNDSYFNGGNVGIGTTSPEFNLSIKDPSDAIIQLKGEQLGRVYFGDAADSNVGRIQYYHVDDSMQFWTNNAEKMRINSAGNVGIGTTNPSQGKLVTTGYGGHPDTRSFVAIAHNNNVESYFRIARMGSGDSTSVSLANNYNRDVPAYQADDNTAGISDITFRDDGSLSFSTGAVGATEPVEKMRIDASGNVGIGTTDPAGILDLTKAEAPTLFFNETTNAYSARIGIPSAFGHVFSGGATVGSLAIRNDTAIQLGGPTPAVTIKSGNVGIGTTAPVSMLQVDKNFAGISNEAAAQIGGSEVGIDFSGIKVMRKDGQSLQSIGSSTLEVINDGIVDFTVVGSGNVGIGTTSPGSLLHVDNNSFGDLLTLRTIDGTNNPRLFIGTSSTGVYIKNSHSTEAGDIDFQNGLGGSKMLIKEDGRVGIGTTSPGSYKLHVLGTLKIYDTSYVGSSQITSDDRVKHNEQPIVGALETLSKITPKKYIKTTEMYEADHDFELDADGNPVDENGESVEHRIEAGVIAQQVLTVDELAFAVNPEDVDEDGKVTSPHSLDYNSLFTYAIAAIQEQQQLIEDLKSRIETLENK